MQRPVYLYECVTCKKRMYTTNTLTKHCDRLTQWVAGIEGKGVNMSERKVKIFVSGYVEMRESDFDRVMAYEDQHMGLLYAIPMGYCDASKLEFTTGE